jgi:hypothetical protein
MSKFHVLLFACLLGLTSMAARADLKSDLVGHWRFENCDGKTVKDLSPKGNVGVIDAGELRKEKGSTSLDLDGMGAHVLVRENTPFNITTNLTASLWVRIADVKNNMVLFGIPHTNDSWTTPMFGMYCSDNRVVYGMWGERGATKVLVQTTAEFPTDTWTLLTATYDGATAKLYLNGVLNAEKPRTGNLIRNGAPLVIGKGLGYAKPSLKGRIGELRLYSRALGTEEVRALYDQTKTGYDLAGPSVRSQYKDGTVIVETHGSSPAGDKPWVPHATRLLEKLDGYTPSGSSVKVNQYGGRLDRPKEKATGFFYVKKIADRQWLIDPEGCRYYNIGLNTVREPKNMKARFGSSGKWAEAATTELRDLGFNGLGNGSSTNLQTVKHPLVWVLRKNFMFTFAKDKKLTEAASGTVGFLNRCMPVFHPEFASFCEQFGQDLAATAKDPTLLGIMTDNELQCPVDLLDRYLALDATDPNQKPGRDAAAAWLAARKGSSSTKNVTLRDRYEFITYAFEQYYRIVSRTVRKYDPNHLYLGSRINYHSGEFDNPYFWKMLANYHDVISVNYYHFWGPQKNQFSDWANWCNRPVILTEWYAKALDAPGLANTHGAGWLVRTQQDRAYYYQHFAMNAFELKNIVGFHFFKYLDDPKESVALDNLGGANKGMFDAEGQPYKILTDRAQAVNREAYPLIEFFDQRK